MGEKETIKNEKRKKATKKEKGTIKNEPLSIKINKNLEKERVKQKQR